jgi:hypothetical protein
LGFAANPKDQFRDRKPGGSGKFSGDAASPFDSLRLDDGPLEF